MLWIKVKYEPRQQLDSNYWSEHIGHWSPASTPPWRAVCGSKLLQPGAALRSRGPAVKALPLLWSSPWIHQALPLLASLVDSQFPGPLVFSSWVKRKAQKLENTLLSYWRKISIKLLNNLYRNHAKLYSIIHHINKTNNKISLQIFRNALYFFLIFWPCQMQILT